MNDFSLCVIGAGPGGYVAALHAAQKGAKVAIIEKENLGGTCLNIGCIPTKTLIGGIDVLKKINNAKDFGIKVSGKVSVDWDVMQSRKNNVVTTLRGGIKSLLKSAGVTIFEGSASFINRKTIQVNKKKISADNFIIATGSESLVPSFIPKSNRVLTSTELLSIKKIPKSILILGGGVIGCEFACLLADLGTKVTVIEMLPSILPTLDKEISRTLTQYMKKNGVNIITGVPLEKIKATKSKISGVAGNETLEADYLLVSIGRKPVLDSLNTEKINLKINNQGWIPVDSRCKTNIPNIYAIGDITGKWQLAHSASAMGVVAADNICGTRNNFDGNRIPGCIFTAPEIGCVGLTEEECKEQKISYNKGKFAFAALGKALAINETDGFCKIIADKDTDQVLGVHIIGPHATDLISEAVAGMQVEITAKELGKAIHPHPTLGEIMMETAHAVHNECAHIPMRRKK